MASHRRFVMLTSALGLAVLAAGDARAQTQTRDPSTPSLFEPHFEGSTPQKFSKPGKPAAKPATVTFPASGAGTTGFDATHARPKKKAKDEARRRAKDEAQNLPPLAASGPDRTVAPVFQRQESAAAQRRRAVNSAPALLDATGAITARPVRRRFVEEDPFGPVGFYAGAFLVKPAVEVSTGFDSNPARRLNGKGSSFEKVAPEVQIKSDWVRHELAADLRGSYIWYNADQLDRYNKPDLNLKGTGRIDITRDTKAEFEGRYLLAADNPGDPNLPTDVAKPPLHTTIGGTAGLTHRFNRLELSAKVATDHTAYDDALLNNGTLLDLSDRSYRQDSTRLRASYETLPGIKPFVEYGMDRRRHDNTLDITGVNRDSRGHSIRAGSSFELTRYLVGEASAGVFVRDYENPAFNSIHGTLLDASLTYYATPLTTLKLDVKTTVDETVLAGVSGTLRRDFTLQVEHAFRRWLIGSLTAAYGHDTYEGSTLENDRYILAAALTYKFTRELHMRGEMRREWLKSTITGQDYTANIFMVGLRLQR